MPPRGFNSKKSGSTLSGDITTSNIDSSGVLDIDGSGNVTIDSTTGFITLGAALADGKTLKLGKNGATEMIFTPHGTPASEKISLINTTGTAVDAISLTSTAGGISIDGNAASNFTVSSGTAGEDLTLSVTGDNDSSLLLSSTGTGTDAVSIDATSGSMLIGPSLADGKTLKLGRNGATEMVFTPHSSAASEKISLTNNSGSDEGAIAITATSGGFRIGGHGNDSHIEVSGANNLHIGGPEDDPTTCGGITFGCASGQFKIDLGALPGNKGGLTLGALWRDGSGQLMVVYE
jgi:hypothetical protein